MFHIGFGYWWFIPVWELTVKLSFQTKHVNSINISDFWFFSLNLCFRFLLFIFSIGRDLNKGKQCQWNQTAEFIYNLNHQRCRAVADVTELQKLILSETFSSELLQCQQRKAPVLHPRAAPPQPWLLSGSDLHWGWAEHRVQLVPPQFHTDGWIPPDNTSDTSTATITSFIANWLLWGFKRFLQESSSWE